MTLLTVIRRLNGVIRGLERTFFAALNGKYPPEDFRLCLAVNQNLPISLDTNRNVGVLDGILGDGFLWAVPRHRRTLEKRWKRKYGSPDYVLKILKPRKNLYICNVCGDDHEAKTLCPTCYKKVIEETTAMQEAIENELKLEPIEQEVVVMYDGEKETKPEEFWQGKRIVEMNKPRPQWFSDNLLQKTTQKEAETSDVKPTELG